MSAPLSSIPTPTSWAGPILVGTDDSYLAGIQTLFRTANRNIN